MKRVARAGDNAATVKTLIALHCCSVRFGAVLALDHISFELKQGQRWLVIGPNGAGKSVLLKLLRGDYWPTHDERSPATRRYQVQGAPSHEPEHHKQHIGYLAPERQDKYVRYAWKQTVQQIVSTGLFDEDIPLTQPNAAQQRQVNTCLRKLRLWSLRARSLLELSYGQRRRVLLARLLVAKQPIWLLDEVFNGLDTQTQQQLMQLLEQVAPEQTWVLAAHSAQDIPNNVTHVAQLQRGKLVYAGPFKPEHLQWLQRDQRLRHRQASNTVKAWSTDDLKLRQPVACQYLLQLTGVELFRDYRPVLRRFDWQVQQGEHWAITGANGAGKSTLLMLIYGDLHPAQGGVIERAGHPRGAPISAWKQRVGYVSPELQADYFLAPSLEHIVASGRYASIGLNQPLSAADKRAVRPWLRLLGIEHLRRLGPRQVSYGQLRLALLARALVTRPQLLLLDEPFTGLDPELHALMRAALQRLAELGVQLLLAVHDLDDLPPAITQVLHIGTQGRVSFSPRTTFAE